MSKYAHEPLSFQGLKTVPIQARGGKVRVEHFGKPYTGGGVSALIDSLPHILAADSLRSVVDALANARARKKMILWGLGGHVIKCGLAPILIDLMRRGYATAFALNGAAAIHDFEIAIAGQTSEDVEAVLPDGSFGAAEETGREFNAALNRPMRVSAKHSASISNRSPIRASLSFSLLCADVSQLDSGHRARRHRNRHAAYASHRQRRRFGPCDAP